MTEKPPAKRRAPRSIASNSDDPDQYSEEYRQKRIRNNEAVKKSREKTNKTANERRQRVEALKKENIQLETKIKEKENHIQTLKDLLLKSSPEGKKIVQEILGESDSD